MPFESTSYFYRVKASAIVQGPTTQTGLPDGSSDSARATYGWYRLWVDNGGPSPGQHWSLQTGAVVVDEVTSPPRCTRTDTWVESDPAAKRASLQSRIEAQRFGADRTYIDVQADPGLVGLMDEANAEAARQRQLLGGTDDSGLDAFDPTFDPRAADSIQVAASLSRQERALLASANPFTEQQRSDLAMAATQHEAIVDAGDPAAAVPEVPSFARRMVGIMGEEYGMLYARRVFVNPFYWLEAGFEIDRDLDGETYFLVIYDENAPDDRDDTETLYLTTAQFQQQEPGKYVIPKEAINLQRTFDFGYKLTIAKGHISQPQFDRVLFAGNLLFDEFRVRWGGLA